MAKYSQEFKLKVVQYYLMNLGGQRATANYFNIDHSTVRKWVTVYQMYGQSGLERQKNKAKYSFEFKHQVVLSMVNEGLSSKEAAKRFKLKEPRMLLKWLDLYNKDDIAGLQPKPKELIQQMIKPKISQAKLTKTDQDKSHEELLEELAYLRAEVAYLKKRRALIQQQKEQEKTEQQRLQD